MIKVDKKINLYQLDLEYNGKGLIASRNELGDIDEVGLADDNDGNLDDLAKIIDNHIAKDPDAERKAARQSVLERLGITEEEAKLLLS